MEVTEDELLAFLAGEADKATKKRIAEQMDITGSFVNKWLSDLQRRLEDPTNVDWRGISVDQE